MSARRLEWRLVHVEASNGCPDYWRLCCPKGIWHDLDNLFEVTCYISDFERQEDLPW